jgi:protein transport protein SEC61 subunit gamma-like protein
MNEFDAKPTLWNKISIFVKECVRVLKITKKPTKEEFKTISKVSGIGILIIGLIGFIVHLAQQLFFK